MSFGRFLLLTGLAASAAGGWWWYAAYHQPARIEAARAEQRQGGRRADAVSVTAAPVEIRTVPVTREGIGSVQANQLVTVRAQIEGRLIAVEFREGQDVKAGDVLARLDRAVWEAQLDQAQARQAQNEATLANARIDLDRYERLAATNAGPRQQADQQRAVVAQLQAQIRADRAAVESARINLGYTVITAPIDGRAGLRQVDPGNVIRASDASGIVTLAQVRPIAALFTLPQRELALAKAAMARGPTPVEAVDTDGRTVLAQGLLEVIDNQVDAATGTIRLKASFANDDLRLWPGQFVSVRVRMAEIREARVVPTPALRRGPSGIFVYVVAPDGKARVRPVAVALQDERIAVIEQGLEPGERVVTAGFQQLADGKAVSVSTEPGVGETPEPARTSGEPQPRRGT